MSTVSNCMYSLLFTDEKWHTGPLNILYPQARANGMTAEVVRGHLSKDGCPLEEIQKAERAYAAQSSLVLEEDVPLKTRDIIVKKPTTIPLTLSRDVGSKLSDTVDAESKKSSSHIPSETRKSDSTMENWNNNIEPQDKVETYEMVGLLVSAVVFAVLGIYMSPLLLGVAFLLSAGIFYNIYRDSQINKEPIAAVDDHSEFKPALEAIEDVNSVSFFDKLYEGWNSMLSYFSQCCSGRFSNFEEINDSDSILLSSTELG